MKLFSRKGLVAAAASAALVSGVMAAPASAETNTEAPETGLSANLSSGFFGSSAGDAQDDDSAESTDGDDAGNDDDADGGDTETGDDAENTSGSSDMDPEEITTWIGVFTAIIGALSAAFSFIGNLPV